MNIEIANRLVRLRKENHLSQEELAARIGVSRQAVSKWERAEASPDTDNLILLARLYGLSLDELLRTGDTPEPPPQEEIVPLPPPESLPVPYRNRSCWLRFPFPALVVIAYLLMGFIGHWWHPGWLVFCSIPLYYAFIGGNGRDWEGAFPVLIVLIYLLLGFFGHWWHPGWLIFLLIPLYYHLKDKR